MSAPTLTPVPTPQPDRLHIFDTTLRDGEQAAPLSGGELTKGIEHRLRIVGTEGVLVRGAARLHHLSE